MGVEVENICICLDYFVRFLDGDSSVIPCLQSLVFI